MAILDQGRLPGAVMADLLVYAVVGHSIVGNRKVHLMITDDYLSYKEASEVRADVQCKDEEMTYSVEHKVLAGIMCSAQT